MKPPGRNKVCAEAVHLHFYSIILRYVSYKIKMTEKTVSYI